MHPPVRALTRGLSLLAELNAGGPSSAQDLARRTRLNRTTTYRLLKTLKADGFVTYDETSGHFSPTPQVRQLSDGLTTRDASSQAALPPMFDLLREVNWPSDFGVFDAGSVMIRESTHPFSPFSIHRAMIGRRRSLIRTALGRAILAAADADLRRDMLEIAAASGDKDAALAKDNSYIDLIVQQTLRDGYASSIGETESNISAIALPIFARGKVAGSLNVIFFRTSVSPEIAARRHLDALRIAVAEIENRMDADLQPLSA